MDPQIVPLKSRRQAGATVVREEQPGYGQACLAGLSHLEGATTTLPFSPTFIAFLDGDYSDHPELLPDLLAPIQSGEYDFVLGSRLLGKRESGAMPPQAVFGNKLATFLMRLFWRHRFTDLGPFRVIHRNCLNDLRMQGHQFRLDQLKCRSRLSLPNFESLRFQYHTDGALEKVKSAVRSVAHFARAPKFYTPSASIDGSLDMAFREPGCRPNV